MPGYTTVSDVELHYGNTLSEVQRAQVEALIPVVEEYIDGATGRTWNAGAVTAEDHYLPTGPLLWLRRAPLASTPALTITVRDSMEDTTDTTLTAGTHYELRNLTTGEVYLPSWVDYYRVRAAYTPASAINEQVKLAASLLVLHYMRDSLNGLPAGISKYSVAGVLSIEYGDGTVVTGVPDRVTTLLHSPAIRRWSFA